MKKITQSILYRPFLWFIIFAGEIIHLVTPFIHNPINALWSDPGRWWEYASKVGIETPPLALMDPVLYQAWLSFVAKFTLNIPELIALYAGLLSAITPWIWYRFLRELLEDKQYALLGWAIFALLPSWIGIYSYFMTETLLLTLLGLSLWASWRSLRKKDFNSFMIACMFWIFTALTRAIAGPIAASIMLFVWLQQKQKFKSLSYSIILIAFILSVLSYRSYERSGMITPFGQPYLNEVYAKSGKREIFVNYYSEDNDMGFSYGFGNPSMDTPMFAPFSDWTSSRKDKVEVTINLDNQYEDWHKAIEQVEENPSSYFKLLKENLIFLFFGPSWPDMNPDHFFEEINTRLRFMWLPLFLASIFLLLRGIVKKHYLYHLPLFSALVLWFFLQGVLLISVNEGRYRKPIEGIIISSVLLGITLKSNSPKNGDS